MESWFRSSSLCIHILLPWFSSPLSFCLCLTFCLSLYPLLLLSSLHPPSAVSDHWWISYVTSRARCSRERGTTPQCWLPPPQMDGHPKTSTPPSCRAKTTAVSDESVTLKWQNLRKQIILITKHKTVLSYSGEMNVWIKTTCQVPNDVDGNCRCLYSNLSSISISVTHITLQVEYICCDWVAARRCYLEKLEDNLSGPLCSNEATLVQLFAEIMSNNPFNCL